jgi:uncharacterized protein YeaO (DUF488 family)
MRIEQSCRGLKRKEIAMDVWVQLLSTSSYQLPKPALACHGKNRWFAV